ncbi:hypothetical protein CQW23_10444 [Capsicum baccatum]|uniref:UTP25 NTP hydrolase-like domain-containing protein n=1 Tax=Capsicum baccatum TaxID=33114 RepID=A0A2G2WZM3_CAPBA|nr:hypothetical protein CQW23_10444 [Capsicum baccatum]
MASRGALKRCATVFDAVRNDDSGEENLEIASEEEMEAQKEEEEVMDYKEPTMYDSLLESLCSFHSHLDHKLSKEEVDKLEKKKWTYKWVVAMSNYKWRGTGECFLKELDSVLFHGLKPTLYKHWLGIYEKSGGADFDSSKQRLFFSICNSYRDILHHNKKPFYLKGLEEDSSTMDAYIMHSLNHIFRTRDLIKKNEAKLAKLQENVKADVLNNEAFFDRGFTRPKVLILLPLASVAFRVVKRLIDLTPPKYKSNVEERERFYREFGAGVSEDKEAEDVAEMSESKRNSKPSDFQTLFGGNNNDHFMIGIKFTRRSIRLYGDFYSSDMIVASPLGLVTKIGEAELYKDKNVDYMSSIEVLIVDHADVILMQNWSHVNTIVEQLNRIPSEQHGTDIMRIRQWYLDGQAPFYRQSIILSSHINPGPKSYSFFLSYADINGLFNHHCLNHEGKVCHFGIA